MNLRSLTTRAPDGSEEWRPDTHQNIKLQRLEIHPFSRVALQAAFSRLTYLSIDIHDFVTPKELKELKENPEKIEQALKVLLSSPKHEVLDIVFDDASSAVDDDLRSLRHPDAAWIGDCIILMLVAAEQSNCLQHLDLLCLAMVGARDFVNKLVEKHAATLEVFKLDVSFPDPVYHGIPASIAIERHRYKGLLCAVAGCPLLEQFSFRVRAESADEDPIADFYMNGRESITKRVQYMIKSPTEPEYNYLWADDFETEDEDEDND